jgi:hypothetical protein
MSKLLTQNTILFTRTECNQEPLLVLRSDGIYEGPLAQHGKDWCDGFVAGIQFMKNGEKP